MQNTKEWRVEDHCADSLVFFQNVFLITSTAQCAADIIWLFLEMLC